MIIIRNRMEIELTQQELREAYWEKRIEYLKEDVMSQAESNEVELDESDVATIAKRFEVALGKCDGYWDYYWGIIEYVINEYIKEGEDNND